MKQRLGIVGQIGVNDERERRQVQPAGRHIRRHENTRAAIAQGLQRVRALDLRQLSRKSNGRKTALHQARVRPLHGFPRRTEYDRGARLMEPQHIDDGILGVARHDAHCAIVDVGVLLVAPRCLDANGVALIASGQRFYVARHGGRKQQRLSVRRRCVEDEFQILAEAEIEHLVRLVEHDGSKLGQIKPTPFQVVAQASGRSDHDMSAIAELACFRAHVHATDARHDACTGISIEPVELALHLHGKLTRRGDNEGERLGGLRQTFLFTEQRRGYGETESHRFSGAGLGRDEQIPPCRLRLEDSELHGSRDRVVTRNKGAPERWMD